jgi:hypothetical protein
MKRSRFSEQQIPFILRQAEVIYDGGVGLLLSVRL